MDCIPAPAGAYPSKFNNWVADRLKERAQVWKQERLYREEQRKGERGAKTRKGDKDKDKGKGKGKEEGKGGSKGGAAAAPH